MMHVHFSFHHVPRSPQIEKTISSHTQKLERLLTRFSSDLIRLHGTLEFTAAHAGPVCSLNLWLPTAVLNSREGAATPLDALQASFSQLTEQVKRHKELLRRESVWKRRRYQDQQEERELAAGEVRVENRQQLREYLDQVLPQLVRFIARELQYREMAGDLESGETRQEEVVNEVVARALEGAAQKPSDSVPPFHLLIAEAIRVLNGPLGTSATAGPEYSAGRERSPEFPSLDANRIREALRPERGRRAAPDRELSEEPRRDAVELLLADLPPLSRQVYVLQALEGFTSEETAQVLNKLPAEVEEMFQEVRAKVTAALQREEKARGPGTASA